MLCSRCYTDATWSLSLYCCRRIDRIPRSSPSSSVSAFTDLYAILELVTILTKSSRSSSSNSISNNKKWMGRRITGTITFSFTHRPWLLRITQSAILYMGGTPDTDNDDDHFQTHPTEQSTGNIQLAAAVLLFFFYSFALLLCLSPWSGRCMRFWSKAYGAVIHRGEYSSYERTYFGSASKTKRLTTKDGGNESKTVLDCFFFLFGLGSAGWYFVFCLLYSLGGDGDLTFTMLPKVSMTVIAIEANNFCPNGNKQRPVSTVGC